MKTRLSQVLTLLVIGLLLYGGVELFYRTLLHVWFTPGADNQRLAEQMDTAGGIERGATKHDYEIILRRNIFDAVVGRPGEDSRLDGLATTALDVVLLGTITGAADDRRAIIFDTADNSQQIYRQGDEVQNAVIKEIFREKIVLRVNGRDEILHKGQLDEESASPVAVSPSDRRTQLLPRRPLLLPEVIRDSDSQDGGAKLRVVPPGEANGTEQEEQQKTDEHDN